jgi:hypothetical protein
VRDEGTRPHCTHLIGVGLQQTAARALSLAAFEIKQATLFSLR